MDDAFPEIVALERNLWAIFLKETRRLILCFSFKKEFYHSLIECCLVSD